MTQGVLPFQYEEEKTGSGMTALAGLLLYLELAHVVGLPESVRCHVRVAGSQGWDDVQMVLSLVLLQLAGGTAVADLERLEQDAGFAAVLRQVEDHGLSWRQGRERARRWRRRRTRSVPSSSAAFRYLERFHPADAAPPRQGQAVILPATPGLRRLWRVNADLLAWQQSRRPQGSATLDWDATLIESGKQAALFCYEGYRAYQPLNVYWAEQGTVLYSEWREGNVPAGYDQVRVLQHTLGLLPRGVKKVLVREDTAGYDHSFLSYCAEGKHPRFGVIEFAVGVDVTAAFKAAVAEVAAEDWQPLERVGKDGTRYARGQEWAEVCFVPNWVARSRKDVA